MDMEKEEKIKNSKIIDKLQEVQKNILLHLIKHKKYIFQFNPPSNEIDEKTINFMLVNNGGQNLVLQTYKFLISKIIQETYFKQDRINNEKLAEFLFCYKKETIDKIPLNIEISSILKKINKKAIPEILEDFHIRHLNTRFIFKYGKIEIKKSKLNFKDKSSVYTNEKIAKEITEKTIKNKLKQGISKESIKILDFGCGTGRFYFAALNYLLKLGLEKKDVISKNLFAIDIDPIALDIMKVKILKILNLQGVDGLELASKNIFNEDMLKSSSNLDKKEFNVIISNPPYFLLKVNKKEVAELSIENYYTNLKKKIDKEVDYFRRCKKYNYSIEGMLNYYKLSLEKIISLASRNAEIGIICPSTLFADLSSKKLRKFILLNNKIREINYFPENARLFDNVSQSTVIFYLNKGGKTNKIKIKTNREKFTITPELINKIFGDNYEIPYVNKLGWSILNKLSKFKRIKDFPEIKNKRGELDLTLYKDCITDKNTSWRLVRGNMVSKDKIINKEKEYVDTKKFLDRKSENYIKNDFKRRRLVCQQISNLDILKRLNFSICNKKDILANSCNYISMIDENKLKKLKTILNSYLLNWRFKISSSNNHINNYELDELPLIVLEAIPESLLGNRLKENILINKKYGLSKEESIYILSDFYKKEEIEKSWDTTIKTANKQ